MEALIYNCLLEWLYYIGFGTIFMPNIDPMFHEQNSEYLRLIHVACKSSNLHGSPNLMRNKSVPKYLDVISPSSVTEISIP